MYYINRNLTDDEGDHVWAVVQESCDLTDQNDRMLLHAVATIREAYGEQEIREMAENAPLVTVPEPADGVANTFSLDLLLSAFRSSLPDPAAEGGKPGQLTNYRSETTELLARAALATVYGFASPPTLHATKGNRNQPILGFDGWTVMQATDGELALVLLQVKGTEDAARPPNVAAELVAECGRAVTDFTKLKGFLMACLLRCKNTPFELPLMNLIVELERDDKIANTLLAPVIVRGKAGSHIDDLGSLRGATTSFLHARARGMTLSLGAELTAFGRAAMTRARQHG
ncbi:MULTISPECIES: hypothetical protein [Rhizobium]|uniref:hypothetical protein n=1 Tax=Rhizobium TaxID=379 RepID=UPI0012371A70|nr:hypothetical protein [Rhizobium phaseoli]